MNNRPKKTNLDAKHLSKIALALVLFAGQGAFAQQKFGDNMGNHSATKNLLLNSHQLLNTSGIAIGTAVFSSSSVALEISATNKALLISRLATNADMLALTAVNGMMVYVTGDNKFYLYQGNAWVPVSTGPSVSAGAPNTTSTANGFTLSALGVLALSPADATNPGIVTTGTQTLAGDKTFSGITTVSNTTESTSKTTGSLVVTGGAGIAKDVNLGANLVAAGTYTGTATLPVTGAGTRLMWIPALAAFRAGGVSVNAWDNIGVYSTAFGQNTRASGALSTAFGLSTASGGVSTAFTQSTASGQYSTAFGYITLASGQYSTAFGQSTTASGLNSTVFGQGTTASGVNSTAMGSYVSTGGYQGAFILGDNISSAATLSSTAANQMTTRFAGGYRFVIDDSNTKGITVANSGLANYIADYSTASYAAISDAKTLVPKGYVDSKALTLAAPNAVSAANAATVTAGVLALSPADATNPGIVSTLAQTLAGAKTLSGITTVSNATASTSATTGALIVTGGAGITGAANIAGVTTLSNATASTSATNGALVVTGGAGITGDINLGSNLTGNAAATSTIANFSATLVAKTGAYTLTLADNGKIITVNSATAVTVTVPVLAAGFNCMIVQTGVGQVTITGSSTTISNRQSFTKTAGQNAIATIIALTGTTFITSGDML